MSLEYTIEGADGVETMTANDLAQAFQAQGYQQAQLSQDGQTLTLVDPQGGSAEVNIPEYLGSKGKVTSIKPAGGAVAYDFVNDGARRGIAALGNHEDLKKLYLKAHLRDQGVGDLNVVGSGDDFYFFDPKTGRYNALTNKPGLDMTDVNEFGVDAAENVLGIGGAIAGGIGGGGLGTGVLGPAGTIIGGAAGSALGGSVGRGVFDTGAMALDKNLRSLIGSEEFQTGRAKQAAFDALGGGVGEGLSVLAPRLMASGIASGAAKKVGGGLEAAGDIVGSGARYLNSEAMIPRIARGVAENFVPVTGQLQIPAMLARAGELVPMGLKAANKQANKAYTRAIDAQGVLPGFAEETAGMRTLDKIANYTAEKGLAREAVPTWSEKMAAKMTRQPAPIQGVKEGGVRDTIRNVTQGTRFEKSGKSAAELAHHASNAGKIVDKINSSVVKAPLRALDLAGREAGYVGNAIKQGATLTAPLENRTLLRQAFPWASEESQDLWRKSTRKPRTIGEQLGY